MRIASMKSTRGRKAISILLSVVIVLAAMPLSALPAFALTSGDFEYLVVSEADKTCQITEYTGTATELTIPSELDGYTVTRIGYEAFFNCTSLTGISLPDSVTSIGDGAFYYCTALTSITIPNSVTSIGDYAFYNTAYYNDATHWENDVLYIGNHLIKAKDTLSGSYTVRAGTKTIAGYAFSRCTSLTGIAIPDSVTSIGEDAFYGCTSLTSIIIPDSVTSIGDWAFFYCTALTNITIPDSVTSIGDDTFSDCKSLTSITIPDGVTSIGDYAFSRCTSLESIAIPNSVTSIGEAAFLGCKSLRSITIPDSVTSIGWSAFSGCSALTSITIPDSVTSIGECAFENCTALTEIKVDTGNPNYTSESGVLFNQNKTALICYPAGKQDTSYIVPNSVTRIGEYAFENCTALASITIPDSVTSIGYGAFRGCSALTEIKVDTGNPNYTSESGVLFNQNKTELIFYPAGKQESSYAIPGSVTSIGNMAFYGCTALTSITIPDSVTSIDYGAFAGCTALESVTLPNSVTSIGNMVFFGCTALTSITIPDSVTSIGGWAFERCTALTSIVIPESVTSIGGRAFYKTGIGTVYGYTGSYAETYANSNGYTFVVLNTRGDINGDDTLDITDYALIANATVGASELTGVAKIAADLNSDGAVDAFDAALLNLRLNNYC